MTAAPDPLELELLELEQELDDQELELDEQELDEQELDEQELELLELELELELDESAQMTRARSSITFVGSCLCIPNA